MQIIITDRACFLSQRLTKILLNSSLVFEELIGVDLLMPPDLFNTQFITYNL